MSSVPKFEAESEGTVGLTARLHIHIRTHGLQKFPFLCEVELETGTEVPRREYNYGIVTRLIRRGSVYKLSLSVRMKTLRKILLLKVYKTH